MDQFTTLSKVMGKRAKHKIKNEENSLGLGVLARGYWARIGRELGQKRSIPESAR
jgi:hypothetical protein